MLFNSIDFAVFLPVVFLLYWFVTQRSLKIQNFLILVVSYIFYGWWDWRFLSLIMFSSIVDFYVGIGLARYEAPARRKLLLVTSIIVNVGFLGFFKYYNFFLDSFVDAFSFFGKPINPDRLDIILPVGISFYTFQTMSYSIDVYGRKLEPSKDIIAFFAFVSFFPQLVAGPIERAKNLLPQFHKKREFSYESSINGLRQILWGLFKKVVIADGCASYVNDIFSNYHQYNGITLIMGPILFAFQVYGDFSGYSDIAIGSARLFGFDLMKNFAYPYFSRDIGEFWRRWHISLSTWFRDYIYIPLGGSRGGKWQQMKNIIIIFTVSGIWHGANWTFVIFGFLSGLYFLPLMLLKKNKKHTDLVAEGKIFPNLRETLQMLSTFAMFSFSLILFRAESIGHAANYIKCMFTSFNSLIPEVKPYNMIILIFTLMCIEWIFRSKNFSLENFHLSVKPKMIRWGIYMRIVEEEMSLCTSNSKEMWYSAIIISDSFVYSCQHEITWSNKFYKIGCLTLF